MVEMFSYLQLVYACEHLSNLQEFLQPVQFILQLLVMVMVAPLLLHQHWYLLPLPHAPPTSCLGISMSNSQNHLEKMQVLLPLMQLPLLHLVVVVVSLLQKYHCRHLLFSPHILPHQCWKISQWKVPLVFVCQTL